MGRSKGSAAQAVSGGNIDVGVNNSRSFAMRRSPAKPGPARVLRRTGSPTRNRLSSGAGSAQAGGPRYSAAALAATIFRPPMAIYALNPNATTGDDPSQRPFETITPLAARLTLTPIVKYPLRAEHDLVAEIVGLAEVLLVSWEHKAIAKSILPAIAGAQTLPGMPKKWDGARFDVVLRFDRSAPGAPWTFRQLFPRLMSGDSATPMQ